MTQLPLPDGTRVATILDVPSGGAKSIRAAMTLAHGAGAGMTHRFMAALAQALSQQGIAVLRFQFPYMEAGKRRTDSPAVATQTIQAATRALAERYPKIPLIAAGKSFGSRMTTTAASLGLLPSVRKIVCYGFPLHPAGEPATQRAEHLSKVSVPVLYLQGTRDELAEPELMRKVCSKLRLARLREIQAADHGFDVLKRSGRTPEEVLTELVRETIDFLDLN